jgi:beta-lactamase class A
VPVRPFHSRISSAAITGLLCLIIAGCVSAERPRMPEPPTQRDRPTAARPPQTRPVTQRPPSQPLRTGVLSQGLDSYMHEQWRQFPGKTGIAVLKIDGGGMAGKRMDEYFPQQSVSKMWVAMTILDMVDQGKLSLNQTVRITPDDLTLFNQPIEARVRNEGYVDEPIINLMNIAITASDNAANDSLLRTAGGPDAVRAFIAKRGLGRIRFGPGERQLQSATAGMTWRQEYSTSNRCKTARAQLSYGTRKAALDRYLADPVDGASPEAIATALGRLARGELLSPSSTKVLLNLMAQVKSGPQRLKAGVPYDWGFVHKTGTGQDLPPVSTGYNDIGIMTSPDGTRYAVVVMIAETTATVPQRMQFMQSISSGVAVFHNR